MSSELTTAVEEAITLLESWRGRLVRVEEAIHRSAGEGWEYDRHGCTWSRFALVVEFVGWRFSGSALHVKGLFGGKLCGHQISLDALVAVRRPDEALVAFKERFARAAERVSVFHLVAKASEAETGVNIG